MSIQDPDQDCKRPQLRYFFCPTPLRIASAESDNAVERLTARGYYECSRKHYAALWSAMAITRQNQLRREAAMRGFQ